MAENIILEWRQDRIAVLSVSDDGKRTVRAASVREFTDHIDPAVPTNTVGQEIRGWLNSLGVGKGPATVVLPRESVVMRRLQLPSAPEDDLPEMVRFQLAARASASIDSLALDFIPLAPAGDGLGQDVISMTQDREQLSRIVAILHAAELEVQKVTVSALSVPHLVRFAQSPKLGQAQPELVVFQQQSRVELSILQMGTVILSEAVQLPADEADRGRALKGSLKRMMFAFEQANPGVRILTCYYVSGEFDSGVAQVLRELHPNGFESLDASGLFGAKAAGFESLAGASLPMADQRLSLDLLHPRKRREVSDRRKYYVALGALAAALLLAVGLFVFFRQKGDLEGQNAALLAELNGNNDRVSKLKSAVEAHDRVAEWVQTDTSQVELWNKLRDQMPSTSLLYLRDLQVRPEKGDKVATYTGTGFAKSRDQVTKFYETLTANGFTYTPPKITEAKNADPDYPAQFDLSVSLMRPDAPGKPAAGARGKPVAAKVK